MYLRRAEMKDLPVNRINHPGWKNSPAAQNIDQWQGGYPNTNVLVNDIQNGHTWQCLLRATKC